MILQVYNRNIDRGWPSYSYIMKPNPVYFSACSLSNKISLAKNVSTGRNQVPGPPKNQARLITASVFNQLSTKTWFEQRLFYGWEACTNRDYYIVLIENLGPLSIPFLRSLGCHGINKHVLLVGKTIWD